MLRLLAVKPASRCAGKPTSFGARSTPLFSKQVATISKSQQQRNYGNHNESSRNEEQKGPQFNSNVRKSSVLSPLAVTVVAVGAFAAFQLFSPETADASEESVQKESARFGEKDEEIIAQYIPEVLELSDGTFKQVTNSIRKVSIRYFGYTFFQFNTYAIGIYVPIDVSKGEMSKGEAFLDSLLHEDNAKLIRIVPTSGSDGNHFFGSVNQHIKESLKNQLGGDEAKTLEVLNGLKQALHGKRLEVGSPINFYFDKKGNVSLYLGDDQQPVKIQSKELAWSLTDLYIGKTTRSSGPQLRQSFMDRIGFGSN